MKSASDSRKVLHIIGHSQLTMRALAAARRRRWRLSYFSSALNRIHEIQGLLLYAFFFGTLLLGERADPTLFAEIRQRIREGSWEIAANVFQSACYPAGSDASAGRQYHGNTCSRSTGFCSAT